MSNWVCLNRCTKHNVVYDDTQEGEHACLIRFFYKIGHQLFECCGVSVDPRTDAKKTHIENKVDYMARAHETLTVLGSTLDSQRN